MSETDEIPVDTGAQAAQRALLVYMRHLSEVNWCAGWFVGLEFTLWDWVLRRRKNIEPVSDFERANLPDTEVLSWLADQADGWWHWNNAAREPEFVTFSVWLEVCRTRLESDF